MHFLWKEQKADARRFETNINDMCDIYCGGLNKRSAAIKKNFTLLGKIAGVDMIAKQARYHESCRREYTRDYERPHHRDDGHVQNDLFYGSKKQRAAYDEAFTYISDYVSNNIILGGSVERMTLLRDKYLQYMQDHTPAFYNPNHKTDKLKEKLQKIWWQAPVLAAKLQRWTCLFIRVSHRWCSRRGIRNSNIWKQNQYYGC